MSAIAAMHEDCVMCLPVERDLSSPEEAMVLLMMLARGIPGEQIIRDLCFVHRRELDECVKRWMKEEP